jgi:AcrR family transcriptional regulator
VVAHRELMASNLLDAFGDLLAEQGYSKVTLADVAARAGMARNTIYNYAPDKQALLMAYVGRAVARFVEEVRAELADLPDARAKLTHLVTRQMHQFAAEPGSRSESGMVEGSMLAPAGHAELQTRFTPLHELTADVVAEGVARGEFRDVDPVLVVPSLLAVIGAERLPVGQGVHDPDEASARTIDFLLHALGAG